MDPVCIASIRDLASTTLRVWSNWNCSLRGGHEILYSGSFGPGRLRGGMFLISMYRWCCSLIKTGLELWGIPGSALCIMDITGAHCHVTIAASSARLHAWIAMAVALIVRPKVGLLNLHFFNICRHHPTLKFKPRATDDERYVWGIDGVPLSQEWLRIFEKSGSR